MTPASFERQIHAWAARLRRRFPTRSPVLVRVGTPPKDYVGWCSSFVGGIDGHLITISRDWQDTLQVAIETLGHEWAHAIHNERCPGDADHSREWGADYADVYTFLTSHRAWPQPRYRMQLTPRLRHR